MTQTVNAERALAITFSGSAYAAIDAIDRRTKNEFTCGRTAARHRLKAKRNAALNISINIARMRAARPNTELFDSGRGFNVIVST